MLASAWRWYPTRLAVASTPTRSFAFFTDREAWNVFRLAAFGEAFGWTLLITGILYKHFGLPNNHDVLKVLGQTHGTFFFIYFLGLLAVATSLRLSRFQFVLAAAASVPPYGTLVYEKYLAYTRRRQAAESHREIIVRGIITDGKKLLVVQPKRGTFWCLPGGKVEADETAAIALKRLLKELLDVEYETGELQFTQEYTHHGQLRLELFYQISPIANIHDCRLTEAGQREYDELALLVPQSAKDLRPLRLRTMNLAG